MIKKILLGTLAIFLLNCKSSKKMMENVRNDSTTFKNISKQLSPKEFETIKNFILQNGDRMTYRNFDSNNPHYKLDSFDLFLGAEIGQNNINNDPKLSDFNQLTIADWYSDIRYLEMVIVREGSLKENKAWVLHGMKENQVYLVDVYFNGMTSMENTLPAYIQQIKEEIIAIEALNNK